MRSAEEVAEKLWVDCCGVEKDAAVFVIARVLTSFADERVKEEAFKQTAACNNLFKEFMQHIRAEAFEEAAKIARAQECSCETCPSQISRKLRVLAGQK